MAEGATSAGEGGDPPLGGRYRLIERIGVGGAASVFLAEDLRLGRKVAIKRLHADSPDHAAGRFLQEAKLGAGLSHPNLVTVFDAFADGHNLVIVSEYIAGPDLGEALKEGPLDQETVIRVLRDVAAALDHTHAAGIVHRDVKPSNVLLAPEGSARLTDLGIARVLEDTQTTQAGMMVGSTPYMAPEQLSGQPVGPRADFYALALTAYEALSGRPARSGMPAQIAYQATEQPPPDIRDVRPGTPPAAADALRRGMARRPEDRPESAAAFVEELERGLQARKVAPAPVVPAPVGEPVEPPPRESVAPLPLELGPPPRSLPARGSRTPRRLGLGVLALLLAALAVVAITSLGGDDPPETAAVDEGTTPTVQEPSGGGGNGTGEEAAPTTDGAEQAVRDFYKLAAADDFDEVMAVASPNLEAQLGGRAGIEGLLGTLESIEFVTLETISESDGSAEMELATVPTHTYGVEECNGTARAVLDGETWLFDRVDVICE